MKHFVQRLTQSFVEARFAALPSERPPLPVISAPEGPNDDEQEESQDQFGDISGFDDIDWSGVDLPAELAAQPQDPQSRPYTEEDAALKRVSTSCITSIRYL
jgi:hypothetical protein